MAAIHKTLLLLWPFLLFHYVFGFSGVNIPAEIVENGEVFSFTPADKLVPPAIRLLDSTAEPSEHSINRRDTADSGAPQLSKDNHVYYNMISAKSHPMSEYYTAEFDRIFSSYPIHSNLNLNNGKNLALTIRLAFPFDFYGHPVKSIVLTTSGFIYVNDLTHPYLTFSQYIAPIMAEFETKSTVSSIRYVEAEGAFWVRWENLFVSSNFSLGTFSFQCAMFTNGSIVFDYIKIPITMETLKSASSVLKIGLSDAFYYDIRAPEIAVSTGTVLRKIVKYHDLNIPWDEVATDGIIHLVHLPTCNQQTSCSNCTDRARVPAFNCIWCYEQDRCSSGVDRHLQDWHDSECHFTFTRSCWKDTTTQAATTATSAASSTAPTTETATTAASTSAVTDKPEVVIDAHDCTGASCADSLNPMARRGTEEPERDTSRQGGQIVLGVCLGVLALAIVACIAGVLLYGFRHPGSPIGTWLIEHRPSRYRVRFFGSGGAGSAGANEGASGGESYKVGSENAYVNFSNA